jgi:hypothetical protein
MHPDVLREYRALVPAVSGLIRCAVRLLRYEGGFVLNRVTRSLGHASSDG